ncbi:PRD domain-containing protein [Salirhabdus salicampi]|uniref:PRD domain-containing protein n=1 Tax=Salirhabdus salicampi TaxID=476102 RepID=UPI0020C46F3C|nr:PRD domain-containing protein [Salirhabdus salicampi]
MRIFKVLNNNAVVVKEDGKEKIVMGPGIAFQKRKNDIIPEGKIEKIFIMEEGNEKFQQLLRTISVDIIDMAEEIISYAEGVLQVPLSNHIHISLTDHLSFAIERLKEGFTVKNKLLMEIKVLYKEEYKIGLWAKQQMEKKFGIPIPEDEAGHIALHIHTAKLDSINMEQTLKQTTIINDFVQFIGNKMGYQIEEDSISHQRLVTHLRFAINRINQQKPFHSMDPDMLALLQEKYKTAYDCADKLGQFAKEEYDIELPISEIGYITLHIQRMVERD